jgi:hypothetical protein
MALRTAHGVQLAALAVGRAHAVGIEGRPHEDDRRCAGPVIE